MKPYPSISGWKNAPVGLPCIAFEKIDGSNFRAFFTKKAGFCRFGSRHVLLDENHPDLGEAIPLFKKTLAESLDKLFRDRKIFPDLLAATVYCEFCGQNSFAGQHIPDDPKTLTIIDVNFEKKGFIIPREFVRLFKELPIPKILYEGNFNHCFIQDVREGKYGLGEGVVAKGTNPKFKKEQHGIWLVKVKTNAWMNKLREFSANNTNLKRVWEENCREQGVII